MLMLGMPRVVAVGAHVSGTAWLATARLLWSECAQMPRVAVEQRERIAAGRENARGHGAEQGISGNRIQDTEK